MEAAIRAWPVYLASTSVLFVSLLGVERRFPGRDLAVVPAQGVIREVSASAGRQTCPVNPLGARGAAPSTAEFSAHCASIHEAEQCSQVALLGCVVQTKHSEVCLDWENQETVPLVAKAISGAEAGLVLPCNSSSLGWATSSSPWGACARQWVWRIRRFC